jgi:phosphoribosylformylglycinamidine synthase I
MSRKPRLAVIQFPGSNCEYETQFVARHFGFDAHLVRWNAPLVGLSDFEAFIVPGGFSFQDRVRAGAIAAKLPIMEAILDADRAGKPILGICNGCQILAEAGLFPNLSGDHRIEVALAPNLNQNQRIGHMCDWVSVKLRYPGFSLFTRNYSEDEVLPIPISHGEGRFVWPEALQADIQKLAAFTYVSESPNGSTDHVAGLCNPAGNVLGLMPHPERAVFLKQLPMTLAGDWSARKHSTEYGIYDLGPWGRLFESMYQAVCERIGYATV